MFYAMAKDPDYWRQRISNFISIEPMTRIKHGRFKFLKDFNFQMEKCFAQNEKMCAF